MGEDGPFRESAFNVTFNPTSTAPPFFQIFDKGFLDILGKSPSFDEIASNDTFAFAHEAPIYVPSTDEVFFGSNDGGALGNSDWDNNNMVLKVSLKEAEAALASRGNSSAAVNVPVTEVSCPLSIRHGVHIINWLSIRAARSP